MLLDGWNVEETAETLGVCPKSITCWQHNFNMFGQVDPPSELCSQPCLLSSDIIQSLSELLTDAPFVYLDKIQEWLAQYHNSIISKMALHNNLQDLRFTHKVMHHITAEQDDEARQHWLQHVITTYTADHAVTSWLEGGHGHASASP